MAQGAGNTTRASLPPSETCLPGAGNTGRASPPPSETWPWGGAAGYPEFRAQNPRPEIPDISPFDQAGARRPRPGRGVIMKDFPFHVNSAAYKLRNSHDHGPWPRRRRDNPDVTGHRPRARQATPVSPHPQIPKYPVWSTWLSPEDGSAQSNSTVAVGESSYSGKVTNRHTVEKYQRQ